MTTDQTPATPSWHTRLPFYYGWVIVSLGFFSAFFGIGLTWAASIFAVPMQQDLGWSRSAIFFAVSLRGWMGIVVSPFIGAYLDRQHGARVLALLGGLLSTVSLVLTRNISETWHFALLFGVVGGAAQAMQGGISLAIVPKWFIRKRGLAVSLSTMGGGLAAFLMPPLIRGLNENAGWRDGWLIVGLLAFVFSTVPVIFLRRQPEDVGLLPDGAPVGAAAGTARRAAAEESFRPEEALRTSTFWLLMVAVSVGSLANNGIPSNLTNIFVDRGFAFGTATLALTAYGLASILAKIAWGWLANRLHLRTVLLLLTAYGVVALPSLLVIPTDIGRLQLGYGFLVGLFVGAYVPLHQLVWAAYFGRAHVGAISGYARPLGVALISSSPFLLAFTRDRSGSYTIGLLITTAAVLACFICLYLVRPPRRPVAASAPAAASAPVGD